MPGSGDFGGLGQRQTPVRLVPGADFSRTSLTAQEGFVLSRVDGTSTLETVCQLTGLGQQVTCQILARLAGAGLLQIGDRPAAPARPTGPTAPGLRTGPGQPAASPPRDPAVHPISRPVRNDTASWNRIPLAAGAEPAARPAAPGPALAELPDEPEVELKPEVRAAIRSLHQQLPRLSFSQHLDADPAADGTTLRRAYFKRSKEFHPDRYFSKRIGPYKQMLDEIFKQVTAAYRVLEDEQQRVSYREMLAQEAADAALLRQVEEQGALALDQEAEQAREDYRIPALTESEPRERRPRSGSFRPRFPWEPRPGGTSTSAEQVAVAAPELTPEEQQRRQEERRRRLRKLSTPMMGRARQAHQFFEQGMRQLAAGQVLGAAASLKLALTFGGEDAGVRRAYEEAVEKSRAQTSENYFKRGLFEESVGRMDTAHSYFVQAADCLPRPPYLVKAAEAMLASRDLIKARDYATKAVQNDSVSVDARIVLARVYVAAGMKKNARRELEEALRLEPGQPLARELLKSVKAG